MTAAKTMHPAARRIVIIGACGAGKTTLARRLAPLLCLPLVELDTLFWLPGWKARPVEQLRALALEAARGERWIIDGNHTPVRDILFARATDVIWLDYSFPTVLRRVVRRTCRRIASGAVTRTGNRQTYRRTFLSRDSIILWSLLTYGPRRQFYRRFFSAGAGPRPRLLQLRRSVEAEELLAALQKPAPLAVRKTNSRSGESAVVPCREPR